MLGLTTAQTLLLFGGVALFMAISFAAIWDGYHREFATPTEKMVWLQLSVLFPFVGGIAYFIFGKKRGRKTS